MRKRRRFRLGRYSHSAQTSSDTPARIAHLGRPRGLAGSLAAADRPPGLSDRHHKLTDASGDLRVATPWTTISSSYKRVVLPQLVINEASVHDGVLGPMGRPGSRSKRGCWR